MPWKAECIPLPADAGEVEAAAAAISSGAQPPCSCSRSCDHCETSLLLFAAQLLSLSESAYGHTQAHNPHVSHETR